MRFLVRSASRCSLYSLRSELRKAQSDDQTEKIRRERSVKHHFKASTIGLQSVIEIDEYFLLWWSSAAPAFASVRQQNTELWKNATSSFRVDHFSSAINHVSGFNSQSKAFSSQLVQIWNAHSVAAQTECNVHLRFEAMIKTAEKSEFSGVNDFGRKAIETQTIQKRRHFWRRMIRWPQPRIGAVQAPFWSLFDGWAGIRTRFYCLVVRAWHMYNGLMWVRARASLKIEMSRANECERSCDAISIEVDVMRRTCTVQINKSYF